MNKRDKTVDQIRSTKDLVDWWRGTASTQVAHDFAVIGRVDSEESTVDAIEVLMQYGILEGDRAHLLGHCVSLIRAWRIMRQVSVFDLGPCSCVGTEDGLATRTVSRSFLIHGLDDPTGNLTFLILSTGKWKDETQAKNFVTHLIGPLALHTKHLPGIKAHIFNETKHPNLSIPSQPTRREQEIARLLINGYSNKEIARTLAISPNTVRNHISHLATKLGARNRTQVAMLLSDHRDRSSLLAEVAI